MTDKKLQIVPLGGLGEFGMNMMAIRYGEDIIVIDAGMMFPEDELLGVDIVTPDLTWLKEHREHVRALMLTHGHEDHIGAVAFFLAEFDVPIYATPFTLSLVERRLEEYDVEHVTLRPTKPKEIVEIGPFKIEFINVTHSIVSAVAMAVTTPLGVIIHTGDFKVDPTPTDNDLFDLHTLADYGKRGVLLLLSDSTNADRPGYSESERAVRPRLEDVFNRAENRLFVSCFSSSIHRLQQILTLSNEFGRKVALVGRSMTSVTEIAHRHGLLEIPDGVLIRPQDVMETKASKVTVLISGTQGEPMSALSRVAVDNHKHISITPGDMVVLSSRIIPGNEKTIFRMVDHLSKRGADVLYGNMNPPLHVSGHGSMEELRLVLNLVRPKYFVPVHGEYRQLAKHVRLASHLRGIGLEETFILETGDVLEFDSKGGARRAGRVTVGRVCIDSGAVGEVVGDMVIRDRRVISEDGIVLPIIAINRHTGKIESSPEIVSRGFALESDPDFMRTAREAVSRTLETSNAEEKMDVGVMKEKIRQDLKRFISRETQRRPMIMPVILEI